MGNCEKLLGLCVLASAMACTREPIGGDEDTDAAATGDLPCAGGSCEPATTEPATTEPATTAVTTSADTEPVPETTDGPATDDSPSTSDGPTTGVDPTTGDEPPLGCTMPDPTTDATYELLLDGWPEDSEDYYFIDTDCTIDVVSIEQGGDATLTQLTCIEGEESLPASLRTARSDAGDPAWSSGDAVHIAAHRSYKSGYPEDTSFEMRLTSDDTLLVAASIEENTPTEEAFAPIVLAIDSPCGEEDKAAGEQGLPIRLQFSEPAGAALELYDEQRGVLTVDGADYAIDVSQAETNWCCHSLRYVSFLIQRVL